MARWVAILSTVKTRPSIRWRVDGGRNVGRRSDRLVDRQETIKPIEEPARGLINIARFLSSPLFSFLSSFSFSPFRRVGQRLHKSPCFYQSTRFERTFARDLIFYSPSHPRERITRDEGSCPIPLMNKLDRFVSKASPCCKFMYTFFSFSFVRYWIPSFTRLVKRCKLAIFSGWYHGETRYFYRVFSQLERILRFFISSPPSKMKPRTRFCRPTIEQQERRRENEIKSARHFAPIVNSGLQHCNHCFFFLH